MWKRFNYPKEVMAIAKKRCAELLQPYYLQIATLEILLESAYLQGVIDAAESINLPKAESE